MTIDPVKIPQNVYVEDRIIGSITLRQIIICLLTGGASYAIFSSLKSANYLTELTGILAWTPFVIGAAFAFIKINGITLTRFCLLLLEKADKPAIRIWAPRRGITISIGTASMKSDKEVTNDKKIAEVKRHEEEKKRRISEISTLLDKGPSDPESIEGKENHSSEQLSSSPPLPVDKTRVRAEPVLGNEAGTTERASSPRASLIRDIAPPAIS